jgi:hypothetical protein
MSRDRFHLVLTNAAQKDYPGIHPLVLDYRPECFCTRRVKLNLPNFVLSVLHLPDRVLDLLELSAYIFAADRWVSRGPIDQVEYNRWSRPIHLFMRVRDFDFWNCDSVKRTLVGALRFMMGDHNLLVSFQPGHKTPPTGLFDSKEFHVSQSADGLKVILFSGGVDSLAGALDILTSGLDHVILASHEGSTYARRTQRVLSEALEQHYPNRVHRYPFRCHLQGKRAADETQRSRGFLFCSIAFALATAYEQKEFYIFENGITSINLYRREDLANARASRTTHPQTIWRLQQLFELISEDSFTIHQPFILINKAEVMEKVVLTHPEMLSSTVSCTHSPFARAPTTHCGICLQCIDRRMAAYSKNFTKYDHKGLYHKDIVEGDITGTAKTIAIDYIRQAIDFAEKGSDYFENEYLLDLSQLVEYLPFGNNELDRIEILWNLYYRHSAMVKNALNAMRREHDDVFGPQPRPNSLLGIVSERDYLKTPFLRLSNRIAVILSNVGDMFATNKPKNEDDLNEKIGVLLRTHENDFRSEYPTVSFACSRVIPDHEWENADILVEAKYIRDNTTPSVATEGIAADLTKYPGNKFILFLVYDPQHKIKCDAVFCKDIEAKGRNKVVLVR